MSPTSRNILASSTASSSDMQASKVCFDSLTIYEFPNLLGDNPGVNDGAPLTIAWKHTRVETYNLDYYEYLRKSIPTRSRREMVLDAGTRGSFLLGEGYSLKQILEAAEEVEMIQASRRANMKGKFDAFKSTFLRTVGANKKSTCIKPHIKVAKSA